MTFRRIYVLALLVCAPLTALGQTCSPTTNPIVCENSQIGNPPSDWYVNGVGDTTIQGFATDISVNQGQTISFKVKSAASYNIQIYRIGYYNGNGARKITTIGPLSPQTQSACITNAATGLFDCGNWAISASWAVPSNATSGVYIAELVRTDTSGSSQIIFVVRNDSNQSALLYKTSDTAWQAYNWYGGSGTGAPGSGQSLYGCASVTYSDACRAFKVSYNRPLDTAGIGYPSGFFYSEYPMVRWLEANGYDVSYISSLDADRSGSLLLQHKVVLSVGHDEYWSGAERSNFEAARAAKVNLAFFSGNEVFWKVRWENSIDGKNTPYRTMVCYKETHNGVPIDPNDPPTWTGSWRDPTNSPPADAGRPENALSGTIFMINAGSSASIVVPQADGRMRFWRNTAAATLGSGQSYTTPNNTLGYEWDMDLDNGFRPAGEFWLSSATYTVSGTLLQDYGNNYGNGTATHHLTFYRHPSGALVFGAGSVQWSWGLDSNHAGATTPTDVNMQQATVNLFADMGAQPATLQSGLVLATASTDTVSPTSVITSPAPGASVASGTQVTVSGTASDTGGVVAGVEVSVNGGASWHPATGRGSWSYSWKPTAPATYTIQSRAVDDSGNLETPSPGVNLNVTASSSPRYTITFDDLAFPGRILSGEYPSGVINWSLGGWWLSGPWGLFTGQSVSFYGSAQTTANFGLLGQFRLLSVDAYNGGSGSSTLTLNCPSQATVQTIVPAGQVLTIQTGWTGACSPVTVSSSNGYFTNFKNLVVEFLGAPLPPPVISAVTAGSITSSGATITWTTNIPANSQVEYGTTTAYGNLTTLDTNLVTSHSVPLTGLAASTLYHYRVRSTNTSGISTVSGDFTFTTLVSMPPVISNVAAGGITATGATITWTTNVAANSQVEYGTTTAYGNLTTLDPSLVTAHSVSLAGLTANTLYHYRVRSTNSSGAAVSGDFTFTTLVGGGGNPPVISNVAAGGVTTSGATITWTTNVAANSQVEYGTTTAYGTLTTLDTSLVTAHSLSLTGLTSGTLYHYRVRSTDSSGNLGISGDFTFATVSTSTSTVTFDDISPANRVLSGQYPTGIIDWGSGTNWWLSAPWGLFTTQNLGFNSSTLTSANFTFVANYRLVNLQAYNGGSASATVTISCPGQATIQATVPAGQISTISTGWSSVCTAVTLGSTNGWFTNFDNLVLDYLGAPTGLVISNVVAGSITTTGATISWTTNVAANSQVEYGTTTAYGSLTTLDTSLVTAHSVSLVGLTANTLYHYRVRSTNSSGTLAISGDFTFSTLSTSAITVTFDDISPASRVLSGQYPTGIIDWGSGTAWWLSAPYGLFTGQSVSFNTSSQTSASFTFISNYRLVSLQAYNGGSGSSTVTISCPGQTTTQATVPAGQISTISTGWTAVCTTVTLGSTNGWFVNFKNLVISAP